MTKSWVYIEVDGSVALSTNQIHSPLRQPKSKHRSLVLNYGLRKFPGIFCEFRLFFVKRVIYSRVQKVTKNNHTWFYSDLIFLNWV